MSFFFRILLIIIIRFTEFSLSALHNREFENVLFCSKQLIWAL